MLPEKRVFGRRSSEGDGRHSRGHHLRDVRRVEVAADDAGFLVQAQAGRRALDDAGRARVPLSDHFLGDDGRDVAERAVGGGGLQDQGGTRRTLAGGHGHGGRHQTDVGDQEAFLHLHSPSN